MSIENNIITSPFLNVGRVTEVSNTIMVRRFIYDIIFISEDKITSQQIIENLKSTFKEYILRLTPTTMSIE